MKKYFGLGWLLLQTAILAAQAQSRVSSADMLLSMEKLKVLGSVLYIAAHPDDENTKLIAYLSKDRLYRTGYLSLTRGDGGQNLIGNEQGVDLGLIRTQELLSARRIDGGEQFFSRAFDFGFSKGPGETFTKWDREKILSDVVWVIRKFQPDVIITRFPTTGEGGHGHHTASAILANEAFTAAADPTRFPEQLKYVKPWQAKRILWNGFNFPGMVTPSDGLYKLDIGGYNPLLGKSYGEIAAESRSQHKSQGFGATATRGVSIESFKTTGGTAPVNDLMDDVQTSWNRVAGSEGIGAAIDSIIHDFDLLHPEYAVPALVSLYHRISQLPEGYWRDKKLQEVKDLVAQCSGLFIEATTQIPYAVQGDSVRINITLNNRLGADAQLRYLKIDAYDSNLSQRLSANENISFSKTLPVETTKPVTQPYWLAEPMQEGYFTVTDQLHIGQPDVDPAYVAFFRIKFGSEIFTYVRPVQYKFTDPVRGEIYWPLVVVPPYTLHVDPSFVYAKNGEAKYQRIYTGFAKKVNVQSLEKFPTKAPKDDSGDQLTLQKGEVVPIEAATPMPPAPKQTILATSLHFEDKATHQELSDLVSIQHDHIPAITYFKPAQVMMKSFDLQTYGKKIGYIVGAGDKVPEALEQMGYEVTLLGDKELSRNNLAQYDAIITGVRAYNTNEWMNKHYDQLMKYVNDGGNLIVQYNTSNNIGPIRAKMGPYPFNVSRTRVTDENADMTILQPQHPVLNFPNKITADDFVGWIQERSIYHAEGWDREHYQTIFSMHDPGESPDEGSLIIGKYGKGYFTYTGIVFFRELPAGVPGSYRLLANLIALNRKKGF